MIPFLQFLSLRVRFLGVLLLAFPVLATQWLLMGTPWSLARLQLVSAGAGVPDGLYWYTPERLAALVAAWGSVGASVYREVLWPLDAAFALAYGAFLVALVLYLLKKGNPGRRWWYAAALVPAVGTVADWCETALVSWFSVSPSDPVAWAAAAATCLKWTALGLTVALVVGGTLGLWARWLVLWTPRDGSD